MIRPCALLLIALAVGCNDAEFSADGNAVAQVADSGPAESESTLTPTLPADQPRVGQAAAQSNRAAPLRPVPEGPRDLSTAGFIWLEGQHPDEADVHRHGWYDSVEKSALVGGDWLSHFAGRPAQAMYRIDVDETGECQFWLRANPVGNPETAYQIDEGEWVPVDFSEPEQQLNIASNGQPDMRFVAWLNQGGVELEHGKRTIRFRLTSGNNHHGAIDAIVFAREGFSLNFALQPGETSGLADDGKWAFEPGNDALDEVALLDLRYLNEIPAGKHGFIRRSEDASSFVDGSGQAIRFWSGTTYVHRNDATVDEIRRHGEFYAKRGVNMVRYHGYLAPRRGEDFASPNEDSLDEIWRLVAGMKQAGIYTTISPYWATATPYRDETGIPDPDNSNMNGLLFFFDYIRNELGAPQLVNAGNWKTANDLRLLDAERWSYSAADIIGVNKYYSTVHEGDRAGHAILRGDHFTKGSALSRPERIPVNSKQVEGHPMLVPESQWVPPNPYQSEGPLVVAAYSALSGLDSFYWFTIGEGHEPPFGKWQTSTPAQMGMFPAAALMFRNGYLQEGEAVVREVRALDDIWQRRSSVLVEVPGFDPNRDAADLPPTIDLTRGVDPLAFLVGPVLVNYGGDPADTTVADLEPYIDRDAGVVRSNTGQIELDYERGILRVDAPKAQAAAGFLNQAGPIELADVTLEVGNEYAAVHVVSMDDLPLAESAHVLVQVGTIARPHGFRSEATSFQSKDRQIEGYRIEQLGSSPWNLDENAVEVRLRNEVVSSACVLDGNGEFQRKLPLERDGDSLRFSFPEDALYVVLRR